MTRISLPPPRAVRVGLVGGVMDPAAIAGAVDRIAAIAAASQARLRWLLERPFDASPAGVNLAGEDWERCEVVGWDAPVEDGRLSLDGSSDDPEAAGRAAAEVIARNCDLLIVTGDATARRGAVGDALAFGAMVLVLGTGGPDRALVTRHWEVARAAGPEGEAAWRHVEDSLRRVLAEPAAPRERALLGRGARLRRVFVWRTHGRVMSLLWRGRQAGSARAPTPYWAGLHEVADELAVDFADRYRSSYVLVLGLAALALIAAVLGIADLTPSLATGLVEGIALLLIAALVAANGWLRWRPQLIGFRLLAELCRKQSALSLVGRSLPASRIARMTRGSDLAWIGWCFAASVRSAPFPSGSLAGGALAAARDAAASVLLRGQAEYHEARVEAGRMREKRLVLSGNVAFGLTVVCVVAKLILLVVEPERAEIAGIAATLLPVVAAAFFGLRAYAEFELLVRQSERTVATITDAEHALEQIDPAATLASVQVGDVLEATAIEMLGEVEGWMELSSVKAVEAG